MKITSKYSMTARLSGTDLALKPLLCSKVPVISRLLKYKLCPPPSVSRVLLSWQLVDPYLYESNRNSEQNDKMSFGFKSMSEHVLNFVLVKKYLIYTLYEPRYL